MNAWQKAKKLENEFENRTKESVTQRFKGRCKFWEYIENRSWSYNSDFRMIRDYVESVAEKYIGSSYSSFEFHLRSSEYYRYNKYMKRMIEGWLKNIRYGKEAYLSVKGLYIDDNYNLAGNLIKRKYRPRYNWSLHSSKKFYPDIDCEFEKKGYPILYKNGIHYTQSFTYRKKMYYSEYLGLDPETKNPIWHTWYNLEPVWQQLNTRDLKALGLINRQSL